MCLIHVSVGEQSVSATAPLVQTEHAAPANVHAETANMHLHTMGLSVGAQLLVIAAECSYPTVAARAEECGTAC